MEKKFNITSRDFGESIFENLYQNQSKTRIILFNGRIIKKSSDTKNYNFFDFYEDHCKQSFFGKYSSPYLVWTGVGTIFQLEKLKYNNSTIRYLNEKGLTIFCMEMLLFGFGKKKKLLPKKEWITAENEISYESINFNFSSTNNNDIYSFELDSIETFVNNNKLKKVTVVTCEFGTKKLLQRKYPNIDLRSANIWTTIYNCNHLNDSQDDINIIPDAIDKHFLSLSLRYEVHKHLITSYLLRKDAEFSWQENNREWHNAPKDSLAYLNSELPFNIYNWQYSHPNIFDEIKNNIEILQENFPYFLSTEDLGNKEGGRIRCGTGYPSPKQSFLKSFCNIVCETKFAQPFAYFSEKVLHCMTFCRPFILVSTPNSLEYLKLYGFKTFDQWWDESYDQEQNHEKRILKIFRLIDEINSYSLSDCKIIHKEMTKILQHNKLQIEKIRKKLYIDVK